MNWDRRSRPDTIMRDSSAAICHRYEREGREGGPERWKGEKGRERESGGGRETFCSETLPQNHHYTGPWPAVKTRVTMGTIIFTPIRSLLNTQKEIYVCVQVYLRIFFAEDIIITHQLEERPQQMGPLLIASIGLF